MNSEEKHVKNLILGGGLSGLSAGYFLGDDYYILEKDSTPGGYCRTIPNTEYVWDYAGHFYHFRTDKYKKLFLSFVEKDEIIRQKKNTKIYYKNKLIDYPFQTNIHELEKNEFIECLYDLYFRDTKARYEDFLGMLYAKFGKAITDKFLRPYNEKLYATDLKELDKDAMGRFFPYADFDQVMRAMGEDVQSTYNDEFMYLKKGTGYFIDKLFSALDKNRVRLSSEVTKVDTHNKCVEIRGGERIWYQNLINTMPFNQFLSITGSLDNSELAKLLSYNKVLVYNLGFDGPSLRYCNEHWVYFPGSEVNFYRVGFYNNILMKDKLSLYVELGFAKNTVNMDTRETRDEVLAGLRRVGIIDDSLRLMGENMVLMDPAYVHITTEEKKMVDRKMMELEKQNVYMLGRYGRWTYNSMEDCMQLADDLAKRLKDE